MEIGYTGPVLLNLDDEGQVIQPYGIHDNPYSVLDVADIVYICPVNTGFSRAIKVNKEAKESTETPSQGASRGSRQNSSSKSSSTFFGVNEDIDYSLCDLVVILSSLFFIIVSIFINLF